MQWDAQRRLLDFLRIENRETPQNEFHVGLVTTSECRLGRGTGAGDMIIAGGGGGDHWGTWATRSTHALRSAGDICDQRSAFLKNSARSCGSILANFPKARMHC